MFQGLPGDLEAVNSALQGLHPSSPRTGFLCPSQDYISLEPFHVYFKCHLLLYEKGPPNCYEMCETVRPCGCASAIQTQLNHGNMEGKKAGACWWSRTRIFENWDVRSTDFLNLVGNIRQDSEQHFV